MTQDPFYDSQSPAYVDSPPAKTSRPWVIVLIVVAVLLLCCCVVLVAGWFLGDPIVEMLRDMGFDVNLVLPLLL